MPLFVFRVDAADYMGTGHVHRCLALAGELSAQGAKCHFITRELPGHLAGLIAEQGLPDKGCHLLPAPENIHLEQMQDSRNWLAVPPLQDLQDSLQCLGDLKPDWCVVDHYGIDSRWEEGMRPHASRIAVIDDLADRPHDADLLIDQSLSRRLSDYDSLLPDTCTKILGPQAALVRRSFRELRKTVPRARPEKESLHAVVSLGGTDQTNTTQAVLEAMLDHPEARRHRISVALSASAPWRGQLEQFASQHGNVSLLDGGLADYERALARADYAVGAGGVSSHERCVLGLPTLLLVLADNQADAARAMHQAQAAHLIGDARSGDWQKALMAGLDQMLDQEYRQVLADKAFGLCNGTGTALVALALQGEGVTLRPALVEDAQDIYDWRYHNGAERYYKNPVVPGYDEHLAYLRRALVSPDSMLFMSENQGKATGHVTANICPPGSDAVLDAVSDTVEVGICMNPDLRRSGQARLSLQALHRFLGMVGFKRALASVHEENSPSQALFAACDYCPTGREGQFDLYLREL